MKKALAVFLILVFSLISLAACSPDSAGADSSPAAAADVPSAPAAPSKAVSAPESEAPVDLADTKPDAYVREKLDAGMEVMCAFVAPALVDDFFIYVCNGMKADMESRGFTFEVASADYDTVKQLTIVENYVTMKCACVGVGPMDANAFIDIMNSAKQQGTLIVFLGTVPEFECVGACNIDIIDSAAQCYNMAAAWMQTRYPDAADGSVHTSVTGQTNTTDNKKRTEKLHALAMADSRMRVTNYLTSSNSVDEGFTQAQDALAADPDTRLFLNFSTSSSVGNNNYIVPSFPDKLDEFGIFTMGNNEALSALIALAGQGGESVCRGTIKQGGKQPWDGIVNVMTGLLIDHAAQPYILYDHLWSETSGEFEFSYDNGL